MDVSVIIVNYNTKALLANCLNSIVSQTFNVEYEIIVVDNNSSEPLQDLLEDRFPYVKLIQSEINLGFGKANNLGAKSAKGNYLFFLNSDTVLLNNAIKLFFDFMINYEENFKIGALGCWLEDNNGAITNSYGFFPTVKNEFKYLSGKTLEKLGLKKKCKNQNKSTEVDFITGADIFISYDVFKELNGFDPKFFMYYEETDLQKRMALNHLKRLIIPMPRIIHLEGGSTGAGKKINYQALMMSQESLNYYIKKHFTGIHYMLFRLYNILDRVFSIFATKMTFNQTKSYLLLLIFNKKSNC